MTISWRRLAAALALAVVGVFSAAAATDLADHDTSAPLVHLR